MAQIKNWSKCWKSMAVYKNQMLEEKTHHQPFDQLAFPVGTNFISPFKHEWNQGQIGGLGLEGSYPFQLNFINNSK